MKRRVMRVAMAAAAVLLLALIVWAYLPKPVLVEVAVVEVAPLLVSLSEEGNTRVRERYVLTAPVSGTSSRIELQPGDEVRPGMTVATILPGAAPLLDPKSQEGAQARLRAAEDQRRYASAQLEQSRAALELARAELERVRKLAGGGAVSAQELERARYAERLRRAEARSAQFAVDVAGHDVEVARAALRGGALDGGVLEVTSPVAGRVLRRERESEGPVQAGQPLLEVGDLSALEVVVDVLTRDAVALRPGMRVLMTQGTADEQPLQGRLRRVEPAAFTKVSPLGVEEQRVNAIVDLDGEPGQPLGDGYSVEARFVLSEEAAALQLPASALFRDGDGWASFVVNGEGRAEKRRVKPGRRNPLQVQVLDGLREGERVIVHPGELVREDVRVAVR